MIEALGALLAATVVQQAATTDFRFPTQPIGPRTVALGGAGAAVSQDAEATLNPATLHGSPHLSAHRFDGYAGYGGFLVAGAVRLFGRHTLGLSLRRFGWDKIIEDDLGPGTADLDASEQAATLTAASGLRPSIRVGAAFSWLAADNFGIVTSAPSVSLGTTLAYSRRGRLGVALRTLGPAARSTGGDVRYPLPTRVRAGLAQTIDVVGRELTVLLDVESKTRRALEPDLHWGVEWTVFAALALRGGYESAVNPDVAGQRYGRWSAGVGIKVGPLEVGLATRFGATLQAYETFIGVDAFW